MVGRLRDDMKACFMVIGQKIGIDAQQFSVILNQNVTNFESTMSDSAQLSPTPPLTTPTPTIPPPTTTPSIGTPPTIPPPPQCITHSSPIVRKVLLCEVGLNLATCVKEKKPRKPRQSHRRSVTV